MDILKIFRMQEPVSKDLLTQKNELGQYREVVLEKDVLLKNHRARVKELENEIAELKLRNIVVEHKMGADNLEDNEYHPVMLSYDDFFRKVIKERQNLIDSNTVLEHHISNLEKAFNELVEKYSRSKVIIEGLMENQETLKKKLRNCQEIIVKLETQYESLKSHSESKIAEANCEIVNQERDKIQEVAKLKVRILQSQATINELEKHVKFKDICKRQSMFDPLKNNISRS